MRLLLRFCMASKLFADLPTDFLATFPMSYSSGVSINRDNNGEPSLLLVNSTAICRILGNQGTHQGWGKSQCEFGL